MPRLAHQLGVYLHLAQVNLRLHRPLVRARMLVLAGSVAVEMGLPAVAAFCRGEILRLNPNHLVGRWETLNAATVDHEFRTYLKQVRRRFPPERAERILATLGVDLANERDAYYSDVEYAASILGVTVQQLQRAHPTPPAAG